jgi:hypothetical protein
MAQLPRLSSAYPRELRRRLALWRDPKQAADQPPHAVIEIADSQIYDVSLRLSLGAGHTLQLRAANRCRPGIRLADRQPRSDALRITGAAGSGFVLDGILVAGNAMARSDKDTTDREWWLWPLVILLGGLVVAIALFVAGSIHSGSVGLELVKSGLQLFVVVILGGVVGFGIRRYGMIDR